MSASQAFGAPERGPGALQTIGGSRYDVPDAGRRTRGAGGTITTPEDDRAGLQAADADDDDRHRPLHGPGRTARDPPDPARPSAVRGELGVARGDRRGG